MTWRAIATVPKDGSIFLAMEEGGRVQVCFLEYETIDPPKSRWWKVKKEAKLPKRVLYWGVACLIPGGYGRMNIRPTAGWKPTHWMPLEDLK